jgi:AcrR family transcriptional regulator/DNA-binding XRE family transcriptional regulator
VDTFLREPASEDPLNRALGARVRELRVGQRLSLRELARRLDVSAATVSQIERGRTGVSVRRLNQIAGALNVPVVDLFGTGQPGTAVLHTDQPRPRPTERSPRLRVAVESARRTDGADWRDFPPLHLGPVLTAALEAFLETGYGGASVRDIARRCDLSVPGLYHYYASKQDMLVELLEIYLDSLLWRTTAARDEGDRAVQRFALVIECLALHHTYRRALAFVGLSEMRSLEPANRERIRMLRNQQQRLIDAEAEEAARRGQFRTADPHDAARAVVTMCTSIPHWYRADGPYTPEEIARKYVRFALDLMRYEGSCT